MKFCILLCAVLLLSGINSFENYTYNQNNQIREFSSKLKTPSNSSQLSLQHFFQKYNVSLLKSQFDQDFLIWRQAGGITKEMQERAMYQSSIIHYSFAIKNQSLYYYNLHPKVPDWLLQIKQVFSKLLNVIKIGNVQFAINTHDSCSLSFEDPTPILCIGKPKHSPCISIPVLSTIISSELLFFFQNNGQFERKKHQLVFRGWMTNGYDHTQYNWIHKSRSKLMLLAQDSSSTLFDVGFTMRGPGSITVSKQVINSVNETIGWKPSISFPKQLEDYKYLINIEGHGPAWRFVQMLGSNNVVFLVEPTFVEHFYADLKPMVHYIPVNKELSDLTEKIYWANANPEQAKQIALQGSTFARQNLRLMDMYGYVGAVLNELSSLQQFEHDISNPNWELVYSPAINKTIP